jgi:hypothetical protein
MGLAVFTAALALVNSLVLQRINRSRDERHGKVVPGAVVDVTELGDESPGFRYVT